MEYNFWQDLLDTYQSLSNTMKILWIVIPPIFTLSLVAMILYYKNTVKRIEKLSESYRDFNAKNKKK